LPTVVLPENVVTFPVVFLSGNCFVIYRWQTEGILHLGLQLSDLLSDAGLVLGTDILIKALHV